MDGKVSADQSHGGHAPPVPVDSWEYTESHNVPWLTLTISWGAVDYDESLVFIKLEWPKSKSDKKNVIKCNFTKLKLPKSN